MSTRTNAYIQATLDLIFRNTTFAGVGDVAGLVGSTTPGNLYVAILTDSGEVAYTGYARVAVPRSSAGWNRLENVISNASEVSFITIPTGTMQQFATKVAIYTEASAGMKLHEISIGIPISIQGGIRPIIEAGGITIMGA